jgi:hypothetical protein
MTSSFYLSVIPTAESTLLAAILKGSFSLAMFAMKTLCNNVSDSSSSCSCLSSLDQGTLNEGKGSVQLTSFINSLDKLLL